MSSSSSLPGVYSGNLLVAGVAFLFGYFGILRDFIPGGVGTAAEIFVGVFAGSWLANQMNPDVKQSMGSIAILGGVGILGALLGLVVATMLNVGRQMSATVLGALFVYLYASRLFPFAWAVMPLTTTAQTNTMGYCQTAPLSAKYNCNQLQANNLHN